MSPLHRLKLKVGNFKYFSRSLYDRFLHSLNNFVAFFELFLVPQSGQYTMDSIGYRTIVLHNTSYQRLIQTQERCRDSSTCSFGAQAAMVQNWKHSINKECITTTLLNSGKTCDRHCEVRSAPNV